MSRVLPILFNTEMVQAILDERKTVTRRVIKKSQCTLLDKKEPSECEREGLHAPFDGMTDAELIASTYKPPYQPGDILYVRETFRPLSSHPNAGFEYASDWSQEYFENSRDPKACNGGKWKPSIHMPKEAAQIWLRVTDVRVERLQEITKEKIKSEGIYDDGTYPTDKNIKIRPEIAHLCGEWTDEAYKERFAMIWDSTIKKSDLDMYGWDANPWVWVIEFERCEKPEVENAKEVK